MRTGEIALVVFVLLFSTFCWAGTPKPEDYSITVHVTASHWVVVHGQNVQRLSAVIDGKKYELEASALNYVNGVALRVAVLALGDYKAKLVVDKQPAVYVFGRSYEILFPDNKKRKTFDVVGQTE